jgi:hypothetical protein
VNSLVTDPDTGERRMVETTLGKTRVYDGRWLEWRLVKRRSGGSVVQYQCHETGGSYPQVAHDAMRWYALVTSEHAHDLAMSCAADRLATEMGWHP